MTPWSMLGMRKWPTASDPTRQQKRTGAPGGAGPKRYAESVAVSSTTPVDFPILPLAELLVRPLGAASTYSRAALGAVVNLRGAHAANKGSPTRKRCILR